MVDFPTVLGATTQPAMNSSEAVMAPSPRLLGRVALVTGGASGIGRATAIALAAEQSSVVIADLDLEAAEDTVKTIEAEGGTGLAVRSDVSIEPDVEAAVGAAAEQFGRVDILVNNAGHVQLKPFVELTPEDFDRMYEVHVRGAFLFCRAVAPLMKEQGFGRIINISSGGGVGLGSAYATHYHAAKAAQTVLGHGVGMALGLPDVTVNSIVPGLVDTPLWDSPETDNGWQRAVGRSAAEEMARRVSQSRLGRPLLPEEVARVVVFLALAESAAIARQTIVLGE